MDTAISSPPLITPQELIVLGLPAADAVPIATAYDTLVELSQPFADLSAASQVLPHDAYVALLTADLNALAGSGWLTAATQQLQATQSLLAGVQ